MEDSEREPSEPHRLRQRELARELRTPRAAAVAGLIFSILLGAVILLMRAAYNPDQAAEWADESSRQQVTLAINLIPFAGIAFLWFIGVIRTRLGVREDKFIATVFLGSGLLFVAMLFIAAALLQGLLNASPGSTDVGQFAAATARSVIDTFASRMAAVFAFTVSTLGARTQLLPRWLVAFGALVGVALLLVAPAPEGVQLLFPLWVFVFSIHLYVASGRHEID